MAEISSGLDLYHENRVDDIFMYIGEQSQKTGCFACTMLNEDKNLFETISFMKNNVEMTDKKEIYVAPVC